MRFFTILFLTVILNFSAFAQSNKKDKPLAETFIGTSVDGKEFNLTELRGKVVLVTFWSTKCVICASEVPKLNKMAASYKDKNVVFLGLTVENDDKVKQYLKKKSFDFFASSGFILFALRFLFRIDLGLAFGKICAVLGNIPL